MKKLAFITASLVMSTAAMATTTSLVGDADFRTEGFNTKEQAYEAGFKMVNDLKSTPSTDLVYKLRVNENNLLRNSIEVQDTQVTVEEFAENSGSIMYRAVIDVDYSYKERS
ncbi:MULTISPECIES: DUF3316 domain-containing protein [Vibrio]|jgi:hypothetical protein|uniref:DUF3316 domain-containing protein n=1 Tax=Vibrio mediterranei TaxID=689 RepID=A0AAJ3QJQ0_9VIBR|nr:DUF3316 domain-containing protein [Vibrio mediterranei]ASI89619.1 hypothetical protein BSZ05_07390 [Vibrio mediterranei]MCG9624258.1 DUF3316 domain-containing protein [Vibrio mediterranei]MCG9665455.1 DUF3316 domain-containing protein [Vibrio mediterranei]NOH29317.1 DUF3316 domain-containing protein [Vibrio mediterranei]NOI22395.1 DUF3316 domain-containing protein [Vibrio mediterranei]